MSAAITPAMHLEAQAFLHRIELHGSPEIREFVERGAPPAPWHDLLACVRRADAMRARLLAVRADLAPHSGAIDFIDLLLTGKQPYIGHASSQEERLVRAYRENAAFAQWLNEGLERFSKALQEKKGGAA